MFNLPESVVFGEPEKISFALTMGGMYWLARDMFLGMECAKVN
ncbi:MAG: hypothetical protein OEM02_03240 [Desulfobulbaceae bacterium]|nr:hypothetical protein [Desulfobulbaceae bacterium]